jgi:pimeloyl-ACP methyl ester carboxylesterase
VRRLQPIRGRSPSRYGEIHWREWKLGESSQPDLVLLHPLPHGGDFFGTIAPLLAHGRAVIAPDYPGYGHSDPIGFTPSICVYAQAVMDARRSCKRPGAADLLGFHTGCLVGVELSLQYPRDVRRLVQIDVPFFEPRERKTMLGKEWAKGGFVAAFTYASEKQFPRLGIDCLVIATDGDLLQPSRDAARSIRQCRYVELAQISEPALENGAAEISEVILGFLEN